MNSSLNHPNPNPFSLLCVPVSKLTSWWISAEVTLPVCVVWRLPFDFRCETSADFNRISSWEGGEAAGMPLSPQTPRLPGCFAKGSRWYNRTIMRDAFVFHAFNCLSSSGRPPLETTPLSEINKMIRLDGLVSCRASSGEAGSFVQTWGGKINVKRNNCEFH